MRVDACPYPLPVRCILPSLDLISVVSKRKQNGFSAYWLGLEQHYDFLLAMRKL